MTDGQKIIDGLENALEYAKEDDSPVTGFMGPANSEMAMAALENNGTGRVVIFPEDMWLRENKITKKRERDAAFDAAVRVAIEYDTEAALHSNQAVAMNVQSAIAGAIHKLKYD